MKSLLPFKVTAAIATAALLIISSIHGVLDAQVVTQDLGLVFVFLIGVITHNDKGDDGGGAGPNTDQKQPAAPPTERKW